MANHLPFSRPKKQALIINSTVEKIHFKTKIKFLSKHLWFLKKNQINLNDEALQNQHQDLDVIKETDFGKNQTKLRQKTQVKSRKNSIQNHHKSTFLYWKSYGKKWRQVWWPKDVGSRRLQPINQPQQQWRSECQDQDNEDTQTITVIETETWSVHIILYETKAQYSESTQSSCPFVSYLCLDIVVGLLEIQEGCWSLP